MNEHRLHGLFAEALADEPSPPPAELAEDVMAQGRRIRQRRRVAVGGSAAGVVVVVAAIIGLNAGAPATSAPPVAAGAAVMGAARPGCVTPAEHEPTDVSVFLDEGVTAAQRGRIQAFLSGTPTVRDLQYESRQQAYERFRELWRDSPDFVASVGVDSLPESFRMRLADADDYRALVTELLALDGVQDVVGSMCPESSK